jgi:hypothetical protein
MCLLFDSMASNCMYAYVCVYILSTASRVRMVPGSRTGALMLELGAVFLSLQFSLDL